MAISIESVRIKSITLARNEDGNIVAEGEYHLIGTGGVTVAKQTFNGYQGMKITPSPDTQKAFMAAVAGVAMDLGTIIGLT